MELNLISDIKAHAKWNRNYTKQNVLTEQLLYRDDGNCSISGVLYAAPPLSRPLPRLLTSIQSITAAIGKAICATLCFVSIPSAMETASFKILCAVGKRLHKIV